jgi:MoxR-like ATPase
MPIRSEDPGHSRNASAADLRAIEDLLTKYQSMRTQLAGVLVGMDEVIEQLTIAILCKGHCILQGMPGLAKTLLVSSMASLMHLSFRRIQFTPDLMPSDITGTNVLEEERDDRERDLRFIPGPSLRERHPRRRNQPHAAEDAGAMLRVDAGVPSDGRQTQDVFAGAAVLYDRDTEPDRAGRQPYPLPEAQLDRFMFRVCQSSRVFTR